MKIECERKGEQVTVVMEGRLDRTTAPELEAALSKVYEGTKELVLDFAHVDYLSSAGLRVLLVAQCTMEDQGRLVVKHVNEYVMETFETTGFLDILTVE